MCKCKELEARVQKLEEQVQKLTTSCCDSCRHNNDTAAAEDICLECNDSCSNWEADV